VINYAAALGSGGFGVPVADILSAPSTPACTFPAHPCADYLVQGLRLGIKTGTFRFESSNYGLFVKTS
jgi:hypothetical protein